MIIMLLTLNIGSGDRTYDYYPDNDHKCINIDFRLGLKKLDINANVKNLPFKDNMFNYVLASDIIEHFPITETNIILTEWTRILKSKCVIEFRLPNLKAICEQYTRGVIDSKFASWLLFGGQKYKGNFHYVGFDRKWFIKVLEFHHLTEIFYREEGTNFIIQMRKDN